MQTFSMPQCARDEAADGAGSIRDGKRSRGRGRCKVGDKQQQALHSANFAAFSAICGILLFNP